MADVVGVADVVGDPAEEDADGPAAGGLVAGRSMVAYASTPVVTDATATTPAVAYAILRLSRLARSRRLASSRRMAARLRFAFRCDMCTPENSSGVTLESRA
ncbi:hypothetical protein E1295_18440 [Nonomuraea mesophila]|uniref:Uncharacterized protein n=1 Tax=Nonomuraea mesophila TaxID=2530382 RepID=A0A4R5FIA0_9ACTN|nr:hypothetical protein E1295_18440 [Nonomuraea mesophila]